MRDRLSDLFHRSLVARELSIGGEKRDAFRERLGEQEVIEWVLMKRRKAVDISRM